MEKSIDTNNTESDEDFLNQCVEYPYEDFSFEFDSFCPSTESTNDFSIHIPEKFIRSRIDEKKQMENYVIKNQIDKFDFFETNAGIWMTNNIGNKLPSKKLLLKALKSLNIPWNDNHENQFLWKRIENSDKISYRAIHRSRKVLLLYLSRVFDNKYYQPLLKNALLNIVTT